MTHSKSNILLLTATITPPAGATHLQRRDPKIRLADYEKALRFYLPLIDKCIDYIVFVENSSADIHPLKELVKQVNIPQHKVEFIIIDGSDCSPAYGRGHCEFRAVEYAMHHSTLINAQQEESVIWKVTGRYIIKNICKLIESQPEVFDIYCHLKDKCKIIPTSMPWAELYLVAWTIKGYRLGMKDVYHDLKFTPKNPMPPEMAFRFFIEQRLKTLKIIPRFKVIPFVIKEGGIVNKSSLRPSQLLRYAIRVVMNRLLPQVWI